MTTKLALTDLHKYMLGFDRFMDNSLFASTLDGGYPRYNIIKVGERGWRIELAIPGWNKNDIEITLHKGILVVEGTRKPEEVEGEVFIHRGLSGKCFKKSFGLSEHIKLEAAYMERGLLCIDLHEEIPSELQPVKVSIS